MANKLKRRLIRFWCWITGGHKYADRNLESYPFPEHGMTCFRNVCVKCGKSDVYAVTNKALYYETPLFGRIEVDFDGK